MEPKVKMFCLLQLNMQRLPVTAQTMSHQRRRRGSRQRLLESKRVRPRDRKLHQNLKAVPVKVGSIYSRLESYNFVTIKSSSTHQKTVRLQTAAPTMMMCPWRALLPRRNTQKQQCRKSAHQKRHTVWWQ